MAGTWTKQQTVVANNGAVAGTSLTINPAATQVSSTLIIAMSSAVNSALTAPAGWTRIGFFNITGGGTIALFKYENNPGAISSVALSSSVSTLLSAVLSEYIDTGIPSGFTQQDGNAQSFNNANGTAVVGNAPISVSNDLVVVAVAYTGTVALTATINTAGFTQDGTTFGTAATSAGIFLFSNLNPGSVGTQSFSATLSATPATGPAVDIAAFLFATVFANSGYVGPANEAIGGVYQP